MSNAFDKDQLKEIKSAFKLFDKDNKGYLTKNEATVLIREIGCTVSADEIQKLLKEVDANDNGQIEESEYIALMARMMAGIESEKEIKQAFDIFDVKGDKFITADELKEVMSKMGQPLSPEDVDNLIKEADLDGDNKVSFEDFKKLMAR